MAVNRPTDVKQKEMDVNAKLQLYGIYSAFSRGKVPSNKQIDVALNSALASRPLSNPSKRLSAEGHTLVADLRDVIEQAKLLFLSKNAGNLLQDFIWQTQQISGGDAKKPGAPIDKDTARQHGKEALEGLRTLGSLIITNGQFRKLLSDATVLIRDIAGDTAASAAQRVKPSEEQLASLDEPAPDNTWHDAPDIQKEKEKIKKLVKERKIGGKKDTGSATESAAESIADAATDGQVNGIDPKAGADAAAEKLKETVDENVSAEDKEKAKKKTQEYKDRAAEYMKKKLPKERRDQAIMRVKKMVIEIQGHQDYQRAIETLLRLAEEYGNHSKRVAGQGAGTVKGAHTDESLQKAEADLKTLLERIANGTSMDDIFDATKQIYAAADKDPDLKKWLHDLDSFIRKALQQTGYIMEDESSKDWNQINERGNYLLRDKYKSLTDRILNEIKFFGKQFEEDPQNQQFRKSLQKLFSDLGQDENGKATFKPHLLKDLSEVIVPATLESIRYVPIPRIEYTDPMIDAIVENLVIESDNLAPNVFELGSDNYFRWGRKQISKKNKNKVMVAASGIQMDLRDVSYYIDRKQGFPAIKDKGVMDILLGGQGFSFKVHMETADKKDKTHYFKINKVDVDVKNLKIKIKQSEHKLLFTVFKPLALRVMRPVIQKVLSAQIKDQMHQLDGIIYEIREEVKRAETDAKNNPDPENVKNIYQRYLTAFNQRVMEGRQKTKETTADKKLNMAITQHKSIFKDINLPGGISTKATEYKELAAKGDDWESPVFSIGSAKESANLPTAPKVVRKHGINVGGTNAVTANFQNQA